MKVTTRPKIFLVASTQFHPMDASDYLLSIGVDGRTASRLTDLSQCSSAEKLVEFMGRICYRSWAADQNANLTKIRENNAEYVKNIVAQGHTSVLEHATMSFVFSNVSRVFTHELVRHRVGAAFSQESLRFVRLTDLGFWFPQEFGDHQEEVEAIMRRTLFDVESAIRSINKIIDIDGMSFSDKKKVTSAVRRIAPIGLSTTIGATFNHRILRHMFSYRTGDHVEIEIREVMLDLFELCRSLHPAIYADGEIINDNKIVFKDDRP